LIWSPPATPLRADEAAAGDGEGGGTAGEGAAGAAAPRRGLVKAPAAGALALLTLATALGERGSALDELAVTSVLAGAGLVLLLGSAPSADVAADGAMSVARGRRRPNVSRNAAPVTIRPTARRAPRRTLRARDPRTSSDPTSSAVAIFPCGAVQLTRVRPLGADGALAPSWGPVLGMGGMGAP
jgi:hypothetical protein